MLATVPHAWTLRTVEPESSHLRDLTEEDDELIEKIARDIKAKAVADEAEEESEEASEGGEEDGSESKDGED
jgi:hypothetical protein